MSMLLFCNPQRIDQVERMADDSLKVSKGEFFCSLPALLDKNNLFVCVVNEWFYHLKAVRGLEDLSSNAKAMLRYWRFLESMNAKWDVLHQPKSMKPTYLFRNRDLMVAIKNGELSRSTANVYIGHVVNFYLWAIENNRLSIDERNKPFDIHFVERANRGKLGHMLPIFTVQTHDLKIKQPGKMEGAALKPLSQNDITVLSDALKRESVEFRLITLLSLMSGLRISEAGGFTIGALDSVSKNGGANYSLRIGPSNGVPTKYSKEREIEIPASLYRAIEHYRYSERRLNRMLKTEWVHKTSDKEPLFITQRHNAYDRDTLETLWSEFQKKIRILHPQFRHRHHNLRSTYGTYRLDSLLNAGLDAADAMSLVMKWMGHANEATTWKYLQFLNKQTVLREKISMLDALMHACLDEED